MDLLDRAANTNNISIAKALLIFYLSIANNYTVNLLSRQQREQIENSRVTQHIVGFIMMMVILDMAGGVHDPALNAQYSVVAYLLFLFTTKMNLEWNVILIGLLLFGFFFESKLQRDEQITDSDRNLTQDIKNRIHTSNLHKRTAVVGCVLLATVFGNVFYTKKKTVQYGGGKGGFDPVVYIFGRI